MEELQLPLNTKIEDDNESLAMLMRIAKKCNTMKTYSTMTKQAADFTGLREKTILKFSQTNFTVEYKKVDRSLIFNELYKSYVKNLMPTSRQLWEGLKDELPEYMDIESFRLLLAEMGFIRKTIKKYGTVVMEKPSITYERFRYLKKKMDYRDEDTIICYVDVMTLDSQGNLSSVTKIPTNTNDKNLYIFYAASKYRVYACFSIDIFNQNVFNKWIKDQLVYDIPPNSVVVFRQTEFTCKEVKLLPTYNGLKITMIEWLQYHEIPHTEDMSKAELMSLVEKYTNYLDKIYEIDNVLKFHNLKVMRIPDCISNFHPGPLLQNYLESSMHVASLITEKVKILKVLLPTIPQEVLNSADKCVKVYEERLFVKDLVIDNLLDDLLERMEKQTKKPEQDSDVE